MLHLAALLGAGTLASSAGATPEVHAERVAREAIKVDGLAADWTTAERVSGFVQVDPDAGAAPVAPTLVAVRYDDRALYVLVEALEPDTERIRARLTPRDADSPSDWVTVWLDPQHDGLTGYRFAVNARGVQADSRISAAGAVQDANWDAAWEAKVTRNDAGWVAEFRIPFSVLRWDRKADTWGIQVRRSHATARSESVLAPEPRLATRRLEYLAALTGLEGDRHSGHVEVLPYAAGAIEHDAGEVAFAPRVGGDVRVPLAESTTLRATVNPDFGQVEADPSELNLSAFETFRAEQRQFFLEGRSSLEFPLAERDGSEMLYYSRRIGAQPGRDLEIEAPDTVDKYPRHSTIVGAAQVVGRERTGVGFAALTAVTRPESAEVTIDGTTQRPLVAPLTSYAVGRVQQELSGGSLVGATATHVQRHPESELSQELVDSATTGGVDFDWRRENLAVIGHVAASHLAGTAASIDSVQRSSARYLQRPDADHLHYDPTRTTLSGYSAELIGGKLDGTPFRGGWGVRARSPGFDANDLGYLRTADTQHTELWGEYHQDQANGFYRYFNISASAWLDKTFGTEVTGSGLLLGTSWDFVNNVRGYMKLMRRNAATSVTLLRGGPAFDVPGSWQFWWGAVGDDRRPFWLALDGNFKLQEEESFASNAVTLWAVAQPTSALRFSIAPRWYRVIDDLQFVTDEPEVILGRLVRDEMDLAFRATWALGLGLTLDTYVVPFLSAGAFRRFYAVTDPRAATYEDRIAVTDYDGDDTVQFLQLRSNVVLRWDYSSGSRFYLVWTHEQTQDDAGYGTLVLDRDLASLAGEPSFDIVMLKVEQRLSW